MGRLRQSHGTNHPPGEDGSVKLQVHKHHPIGAVGSAPGFTAPDAVSLTLIDLPTSRRPIGSGAE